jgi:RNA polymerase sigma-70 factor (ECF subfamily)
MVPGTSNPLPSNLFPPFSIQTAVRRMRAGAATLTGAFDGLSDHATATPNDTALAAAGDMRAFERLYRTHVSRVHSLARRMMGGRDADELTQDIFVRAWQKLGTFRGESAFGTWLHRLAVNVILEHRRTLAVRMGRHYDGEDVFDRLSARSSTPDLAMDLDAALEKLPAGARHVFVLHDIEGYKHREIAAALGISSGTSKTQLHRARMLLRGHLRAE